VEYSSVPILMYHSVSTSTNPLFKRWAVPAEMFDEHLSYLSQNQYTPITITDLVRARSNTGAPLPGRPVVLTFDDAYEDFYANAFPALARHGFVATLYVPTAYVGGTSGWLRHEGETLRPIATWTQLAEISEAGIECGGHSHGHMQMDAVPLAIADADIRRCKAILEDHLGRETHSFAYPHGWTTYAIKRLVQSAGFTSACAVKNMLSSPWDDAFELARLVVTGDMNTADIAELLARRVTPLEETLRNAARPLWRFVPRSRAWLRSYLPQAVRQTAVV
jgi:peptidoglycan/xylan/chitin deacetylase (PgdA/CDA1 family)